MTVRLIPLDKFVVGLRVMNDREGRVPKGTKGTVTKIRPEPSNPEEAEFFIQWDKQPTDGLGMGNGATWSGWKRYCTFEVV